MYVNIEFALPSAAKELKYFDDLQGKQKKHKSIPLAVENVNLEDDSVLLFQKYDTVTRSFFDVYWVRSIDDIYKIKLLYPYEKPPTGHHVDHLVRNDQDELVVVESNDVVALHDLKFDAKRLKETLVQPESLPYPSYGKKS